MSRLLVTTFLFHMQETNHAICFTTFGPIIKQAQTMHDCPAFNVTIGDSAHVMQH